MNKSIDKTTMMGNEKIESLLIKLSLPAIIGLMITAIYNIVDTLFVSKLGTSAVGAASVAYPLFLIIAAVGLMFGIGAASYISRLLGSNNKEKANQVATTTVVTGAAAAVLLTIVLLAFMNPILKLLGASPTIITYAIDYSKALAIGSIFTILNMIFNNILRAEGNAKYSMFGLLTGALLNIVLDPLFIFTLGMGIKGAAIATVISQFISTLVLFSFFLRKKTNLRIEPKYISINKNLYMEISKIGIPTFFRQFLVSVSMALINNAAMPYGDVSVAAIGISNKVFSLGAMIVFGFSQGFQPIAGYNYGAGNIDRLKKVVSVSLRWGTIFTTVLAFLLIAFADGIIGIFSTDPEVINIGTRALRALALPFPLFAFQTLYGTLFQALGKGKEAGILALSRQGFFLIPIVLILPSFIGLNGVIYSQTIADGLTILLTLSFATKVNKEINEMYQLSPVISK